jgi:hypothetical protein
MKIGDSPRGLVRLEGKNATRRTGRSRRTPIRPAPILLRGGVGGADPPTWVLGVGGNEGENGNGRGSFLAGLNQKVMPPGAPRAGGGEPIAGMSSAQSAHACASDHERECIPQQAVL